MPQITLEDSTVRQIIKVTTTGSKIRFRLSNQYGGRDVTIKSMHIAKQVKASNPEINTDTDATVTFEGKENFIIPKGKVIQTDAIDFPVQALENVAISTFLVKRRPQTLPDTAVPVLQPTRSPVIKFQPILLVIIRKQPAGSF